MFYGRTEMYFPEYSMSTVIVHALTFLNTLDSDAKLLCSRSMHSVQCL